ncbi:MAG: glutamate racemase, partial [Clostridiales bacterium]|nr:glutamate racemase [Clostridiales bacterium]
MEEIKYAPIGVFDSGVGGLTVAREIMRQIPDERIVYFGDTARVPYGSKSRETIIRFSRQIIHFLRTKDVKAVVVACNTASALALETLQPELDIPIIGVVTPGAKVAAEATENGKIGVIATESTIESRLYTKVIRQHNPRAQVFGKACPLFCPLVEEGWLKDPVT